MILRGFVAEDFAAHEAIMRQPEVTEFLGPAMSREDHWRRIISAVGQWIVNGYGGWMVEYEGRVVGNCGFFDGQRGIEPVWDGQPEMGWIFGKEVHGLGIAGEACRAALDWADEHLQRDIWAMISPGNDPSFKLAERLGFELLQRSKIGGEEDIDVLKRPWRG